MNKNGIRAIFSLLAVLAPVLILSACRRQTELDPTAAPTPGIEVMPTSTPIPGGCSDGMQFLGHVTVPDGTAFGPGETFLKTWRVRNAGSCDWVGYHAVFVGGTPMGVLDQPIPATAAGEEVEIAIAMTAPDAAGTYVAGWQVRSPQGANLGAVTCAIVVAAEDEQPPTTEPTETPTEEPTEEPTATLTPTPTGEPTEEPTEWPTATPTEEPTAPPEEPTATVQPTATPSPEPALEAPSNLEVVKVTRSGVTLVWEDNSDGEEGFSVEHVVGEDVVVLAETGPDETTIGRLEKPGCGETFEYRVRAFNSDGYSDPSNLVSLEGACN